MAHSALKMAEYLQQTAETDGSVSCSHLRSACADAIRTGNESGPRTGQSTFLMYPVEQNDGHIFHSQTFSISYAPGFVG